MTPYIFAQRLALQLRREAPSAGSACYGSISQLQPLGDFKPSNVGNIANLVHQFPVAFPREARRQAHGVGVSVLRWITGFPHNAPAELGLHVLVDSPSDVVEEFGDRAAVVVQNVGVKPLVEVRQCEQRVLKGLWIAGCGESFLQLLGHSDGPQEVVLRDVPTHLQKAHPRDLECRLRVNCRQPDVDLCLLLKPVNELMSRVTELPHGIIHVEAGLLDDVP